MANFSVKLTAKGRLLLADVQAGAELDATRLVIGSGYIPVGKTAETMTALVAEEASLDIVSKERTPDGYVIYGGYFSGGDFAEEFYYREVALFARAIYRDENGAIISTGDEMLYAYGNSGDDADLITDTTVERLVEIVSYVGNDTAVNMEIASGIYVTHGDFDSHASRHAKGGDDAITPADIGAAPAGFGYGDIMVQISATSANQSIPEFCQNFDAILDGMTSFPASKQVGVSVPWAFGSGYYMATVYKYSAKYSVVVGYSSPMYASAYGWRITREDTTWGEVEWINAPMRPNVEYRTTERIDGKAVYKKNVNGVIQYRLEGETTWKDYAQAVGAALAGHTHTPASIGAAVASHTHDDRYYTETEVNRLLTEKAPAFTWGEEEKVAGSASTNPVGSVYLVLEPLD